MRATGKLGTPAREKLLPVRLGRCSERSPNELAFGQVLLGREQFAHELEAQPYKVGVRDIGLAITSDIDDFPAAIRVPHLRSIEPELAGESQELRELVERCARPQLVERQEIHQVAVTQMIAADVVVVAELAVLIARFPVAPRPDAMYQGAIMEDRQVEAAAIPRNELRRVLGNAVEEPLDELSLRLGLSSQ